MAANPEADPLLGVKVTVDGGSSSSPTSTTQQPPAASPKPVKDDPTKQGYFGRAWNFVSHRHSLLCLFFRDFDNEWPREAAIWMFFFTILLNIYFMLQYLYLWNLGGKIFLVLFCVLPTKCIAKWTVNKWGYEAAGVTDPEQKKFRARIIMAVWFGIFFILSFWRLFEVDSGFWGLALYGFAITWGSTMVAELFQWWIVYTLVDTCCPCCVGCCLTSHEIAEAKTGIPASKQPAAGVYVSGGAPVTGGSGGGAAGASPLF